MGAIGVNCVIGPEQTLRAVKALREISSLPISAQPNSGFPAQVDGRTLFVSGPAYFAARGGGDGERGREHGRRVLRDLAGAYRSRRGGGQGSAAADPSGSGSQAARGDIGQLRAVAVSPLMRRMNGEFVTVEVTPPRDSNYQALIEKLQAAGRRRHLGDRRHRQPHGPRAHERGCVRAPRRARNSGSPPYSISPAAT